jgi:hypothetical protein
VVLDQQHRDASRRGCRGSAPEQPDLLVVQAARRLVEQQSSLGRRPAPRQLDALLVPNGRSATGVRERIRAEQLRSVAAPSSCVPALARDARQAQRDWRRTARGAASGADHDVVEHAHGAEQGDVLEGAADAEPAIAWRGICSSACAVERCSPLRTRRGATGS